MLIKNVLIEIWNLITIKKAPLNSLSSDCNIAQKHRTYFYIAAVFISLPSSITSSYASDSATLKTAEEAPLTIDSRDGLQCDKVKQICTAEGQVIVRKGTYEMFAKKGIAYMRKDADNKSEVYRIEAFGDVEFFGLNGEAAKSDEAYFDLDEKVIKLIPKGKNQVHVWRDDYILLANDLIIHLKPGEGNNLTLSHIDAAGRVYLSSPEELVKGDNATYTPDNSLVVVTGDVRVNRSEGQLRGTYAQVNIDTKISKVLKRPDIGSDQRVRVLVYPNKVKSSSLNKPAKQDSSN